MKAPELCADMAEIRAEVNAIDHEIIALLGRRDVQMQAMLQTFLNVVEFGMPLQRAIEMPRAWSANFPNSFAPHGDVPGTLCVEEGIEDATMQALRALGHRVEPWARFAAAGGGVCAVMKDHATGLVHAGADPRRECYAIAW